MTKSPSCAYFCQGKRAFGLLQKCAKYAAQTKPPAKNTHKFISTKLAFQGSTNVPFPEANPKKNQAKITLTNDQTTFKTGDETTANGVMWVWPVIPLTKCGIALKAENPARKYQSNSKFITSFAPRNFNEVGLHTNHGHKSKSLSNSA